MLSVSENKTLCHPASVDSISTSAGTEDHVSMGGFAARKALQVVRNVEKVSDQSFLDSVQYLKYNNDPWNFGVSHIYDAETYEGRDYEFFFLRYNIVQIRILTYG